MSVTSTPRRRSREPKRPKSCHDRALGLLAVRPRARRELERRLSAAGFAADEVSGVLARLERAGLVDDEAFARQMAEYQFASRRAGARAVTRVLLEKGIAPDLAARVTAEAPDDEHDRALELARTRAPRLSGFERPKAFQRLTSLLMRRGYAPEIARSAARSALGIDVLD